MPPGASPRIRRCSWGRIELEDGTVGRDLKLFPGGARAWDWRETDTHHVPGIQVTDVEELLEHGAEVVVLSRGVLRRLRVPAGTVDWLAGQGVEVRVDPTQRAVEVYNELCADRAVGGLFHSTC